MFKGACIRNMFHPAWDKIYGDPSEPATAVVFGEKGSGKTAMRLQVGRHLADYNAEHPDHQVFVVQYDDFNPFLDRFRDAFRAGGGGSTGCWTNGGCGTTSTPILSLARDAIGRSDPGGPASPASGRPRRAAAHRKARRRPGPRRDAAGGVLRPIDGRELRSSAGSGCGGNCGSPPGGRNGTWRWAFVVTLARCRLLAWRGWHGDWSLFGHWWPYVGDRRRLAAAAWRLWTLVVEGMADRPQHAGLASQHEAALPDAAELSRRADRRPAAARLAAYRRPL